jgi:hypothetical protein
MIGSPGDFVTGAMIWAPSTGWAFIVIRSSRVSRSFFSRTLSGTPILPTSWRPPTRALPLLRVADPHPADVDRICFAMAVPAGVRIALVNRPGQRPDGLREHVRISTEVVGDAGRVEGQGEQIVAHSRRVHAISQARAQANRFAAIAEPAKSSEDGLPPRGDKHRHQVMFSEEMADPTRGEECTGFVPSEVLHDDAADCGRITPAVGEGPVPGDPVKLTKFGRPNKGNEPAPPVPKVHRAGKGVETA